MARSHLRLAAHVSHRRRPWLLLARRMAGTVSTRIESSADHAGGAAIYQRRSCRAARATAFYEMAALLSADVGHSAGALLRRSHLVAVYIVAANVPERCAPLQ